MSEPEPPQTVRLGSVGSTQDVARDLPVGSVVVADHQTSGRGRLARTWEAQPGAGLYASFVVRPIPLLSLAAGVAAAQACGPAVRLKWPNDLLLGERKLGGILIEVTGEKAVVGVGVNLRWAPAGAARLGVPRDQLLADLKRLVDRWTAAPPSEILKAWRALAETLGRKVRVELPDRVLEGLAQDVDENGSLIVDGVPVSAGDVIHLRT